MTDFELNRAIAELVFAKIDTYKFLKLRVEICPSGVFVFKDNLGGDAINENWKVDYTNNWNDLMPLVVEHGISFLYDDESKNTGAYWHNDTDAYPVIQVNNINPQRALAECLLLVLQDKNK